jgi:molecular chaperone DnaK
MAWQLEKLIEEHAAKLSAADKEAVGRAIEKTRAAAKGEDPEALKAALHELEQASHALSKTLYATAGAQGPAAGAAPGDGARPGATGQPGGTAPGGGGGEDEAIDAEFEVK